VLKSLCHEKRHRSETAKQFFRSSVATHFNCRVTAQGVDSLLNDTEQHSTDDLACNGDHDNRRQQQQQQQQQQE